MVIGGKMDRNGNRTCSILPIKKHDDKKVVVIEDNGVYGKLS